MDGLTGLLDGPRSHKAFLLRVLLTPPWSIRVCDEAPLAIVAVVRGTAWFVPDDAPPERLDAGDIGIVLGPDHYTMAADATLPADIVIHPGQRCTTVDGLDVHALMERGVRTWGNDPEGSTELVVGTYHLDSEVGRRLLSTLPRQLAVGADASTAGLVGLLAAELQREVPGQQAVLDRLLDLLLITALRAWFDAETANAPLWYAAGADPVVGAALRLIHDNPAAQWTVANLASKVGTSRSVLAKRFTELVGQPVMQYLTDWRMSLATDLLRQPGTTVASVAGQVGYTTPYAFSHAYKRVCGVRPGARRPDAGSPRPAVVRQ
jgi:AraC-like DNA-binding protein